MDKEDLCLIKEYTFSIDGEEEQWLCVEEYGNLSKGDNYVKIDDVRESAYVNIYRKEQNEDKIIHTVIEVDPDEELLEEQLLRLL